MPSCERCWADAHSGEYDDPVEQYHWFIASCICTPEQQAGPDVGACPRCERRTMHQHCHVCMWCGYDPLELPEVTCEP